MAVLKLSDIELFLLDMDGTFYLGDKLIPGALEFLEIVKSLKKKFMFLTNNSSKGPTQYVEKLKRLGVDVNESCVFSSAEATAMFLLEQYGKSKLFLVGTKALAETLKSYGHTIDEKEPQMVVLGYDTELTYEKLAKACLFLRKGLPYIATHPDINCPSEEGPLPDAGSIIALIERSTGRTPDYIVGKPNQLMMQMISKRFSLPPHKIAMVGDRLYTDMEFALRSGAMAILVLSGETQLEHLQNSQTKPHLVVENIEVLAKMLKRG
ncbi:HAD-IIA family hydrolase [Pseudothermotoga sp.]|uniref:HAD-IIA family hydrolase n=1 Tax=Pseudothermotoga sp. TaxID=2033661 RepID=UPI0031F60F8F